MHSKKPFKRIMVVKSSKVLQDLYNEIIIQPKAYFIFSRYDFPRYILELHLDCKITRLSCSVSTIIYQALRNKYNQPCYKHIILCVFCLNFNYAEEQISNEK